MNKLIIGLSLLITLCYSNTFHVPWHLDDPPNIITNYPLHIDNLYPETLWQTFFAQPFTEGKLYRPIANLSFALNWYFGQDNPFGYHLVNLFIHILTALFLYKTILLLLRIPSLKKYPEQDIFFVALLSALLWAINPIQTQAVTYIVQRMASMSAMFFIFAVYIYIRARQSRSFGELTRRLLLCGLFFFLALGCKENAVTLIPSLLLIELLFFKRTDQFSRGIFALLIVTNIFFILAATYYIYSHYIYSHDLLKALTTPMGSRPFSLLERLLTQPSIILFYLSLLLYPSPARLSIDHSFPLSTSLFHPWTTLPALLCIVALIIFAVLQRRRMPLLSLAILFFFINHLVESTIIPLEMIFEHRNYLPSFFLFLPIAAGIYRAIKRSLSSSRLVHTTLVALIPILLIAIGLGTYSRNQTWATEESLWADTLPKAPNNSRSYAKLGEIYGWHKEKTPENFQTAIALFEKSINLESPRTSFKAAIAGNIGKVYFNYGLFDQAVSSYQRSLELNPDFLTSRFDLTNALTMQGKFDQALQHINQIISKNDLQSRFFNLKAHLLLWLGHSNEAVEHSGKAIHRTIVNKERYFYNCGVALTGAGHTSQGLWFLNQALKQEPENRKILYSLIENRLLAHNTGEAQAFAGRLIDQYGLPQIKSDLERLPKDYGSVPVNVTIVTPAIIEAANRAIAALR